MADEDELDYHVTFPPTVSSGPANEPVVILLGWMGCVDKHLAKYSAIYQSKGFTTIRYVAPTSKLLRQPDSLRDTARKLLELLFELGLEENQVMLHVFSNGGSFIYRHMMELVTDPQENPEFAKLKLVGSILDSTPTDATAFMAAKAMYHSADRVTPFLLLLIFLFLIAAFISFLMPDRFRPNATLSTHLKSIEESRSRSPQLFIYSTKDALCDYKTVEGIIAKRRAAGVEVWQQCWDDTDHVSHFRVHREEYMAKVSQFVDFCLQQ